MEITGTMSSPQQQTLKTAGTGIIASIFTWVVGAFNWYADHLQQIGAWLSHLAQIGGLIVIYFSIKKLIKDNKKGNG